MTSFLNHFFANVSGASGHTWTNNVDTSFLIPQNASLPELVGIGTAIPYSTNVTTTTLWYPSLLHPFDELEFLIGAGMRGDSDRLSDFNRPINDFLSWENLQGSVWSNDSTQDSKSDSKSVHSAISTTSEASAALPSVFTFTTHVHGSSDSVYLAFVPVLKSKPVCSIGLASIKTSHISPVVVSLRPNGAVDSVKPTSTAQFQRRIDFGRSIIAPTLVISSLARRNGTNLSQFFKRPASTRSSASRVLASSLQYSVQPAPTLMLRSSSTVPSPSPTVVSNHLHATPTSARKPTKDDPGPPDSTSKSKHSTQRQQAADEVVNKLTQYVEVSEGPFYMFPKYDGEVVSTKEKKLKPTGTLRTATENSSGPSPTSTNVQSPSQLRRYSSQIIKPSETSSASSTAVESKSSTTQPISSKRGTQPGRQSESSGSSGSSRPHPRLPFTPRPPPGYYYVAHRELFAYYYVFYEDEQGRRLESMISKKETRREYGFN